MELPAAKTRPIPRPVITPPKTDASIVSPVNTGIFEINLTKKGSKKEQKIVFAVYFLPRKIKLNISSGKLDTRRVVSGEMPNV